MMHVPNYRRKVRNNIRSIQNSAISYGVQLNVIKNYDFILNYSGKRGPQLNKSWLLLIGSLISIVFAITTVNELLSARCLIPSNYMVWEATRPVADCSYCVNVSEPIILRNITRPKFEKYAYSSKPIIVKNAIGHWRAIREFSYEMFKKLYEETTGSYESLDEGCQFLNFKSDLFSLKEVFSMPVERVYGVNGQTPWYVGWGNCHEDILRELRKFYDIPDFLPEDAEYPATENIFMGFEIGAVMHLDYIERLMWQGQVKGTKMWSVAPVPECENVCHKFSFYVEPTDIIFLDTRIWYHETKIPRGQFSITVQSEYG